MSLRGFKLDCDEPPVATDPEVALAWAVIGQAIHDARDRRAYVTSSAVRAEACDFLASRLWEWDNLWGLAVGERVRASLRARIQQEFRRDLLTTPS